MYQFLLSTHSHSRWLILTAALFALILPLFNPSAGKQAKLPALILMILCDVQLLLGLMLYFGESPYGLKAFENGMSSVMKTSEIRKIAVEHLILMIAAISLVHIGYTKIKKATLANQIKKYSLIFFGIAFILILAGIPWARL